MGPQPPLRRPPALTSAKSPSLTFFFFFEAFPKVKSFGRTTDNPSFITEDVKKGVYSIEKVDIIDHTEIHYDSTVILDKDCL